MLPVLEKFLKDQLTEIRVGALKNLHIFLNEVDPEKRERFIKYIIETYNDA